MKINRINTNYANPAFKGGCTALQHKFANTFANIDGIGEGASIAFDFLGKAVVMPAVIMLASKEPKEKKEYSALKNPVAATIQLALEAPILFFGSKAIEKAANKGLLDKGQNKQYNEKFFKDSFTSTLRDAAKENSASAKRAEELINNINVKGLTKKIAESAEDLIETLPEKSKDLAKKAFQDYNTAHRKLYHLQNRLCFAAAIILTPLICALENKLPPIVMDKIYEKESLNANKHQQANVLKQEVCSMQNGKAWQYISIHAFIKSLKKGAAQ